MEQRL
jgi:hypothetical protein